MKSVLISIQPKDCKLIANGEKTIEVRKSRPKIETPFKCYIYCTYGQENENYMLGKRGKVIGEFICNEVEEFSVRSLRSDDIEKLACLSYNEMINYFYKPEELDGKTVEQGFAWHISNLKIYDQPKELSDFYKPCPTEQKGNCYGYYYLADRDYGGICANNLIRPPQSWCYVEEC